MSNSHRNNMKYNLTMGQAINISHQMKITIQRINTRLKTIFLSIN